MLRKSQDTIPDVCVSVVCELESVIVTTFPEVPLTLKTLHDIVAADILKNCMVLGPTIFNEFITTVPAIVNVIVPLPPLGTLKFKGYDPVPIFKLFPPIPVSGILTVIKLALLNDKPVVELVSQADPELVVKFKAEVNGLLLTS